MLMEIKPPPIDFLGQAEKILPRIDSVFCGKLSGEEAMVVIREGERILYELKRISRPDNLVSDMIASLANSIEMARKEIGDEH